MSENSEKKVDLNNLEKTEVEDINNTDYLDSIIDIPVTISVEIGRTKLNIRSLLQLQQGSIVELDRFAGDPLDIFVNNALVAHGEVVVINDKFGVRITDVVNKTERIRKMSDNE